MKTKQSKAATAIGSANTDVVLEQKPVLNLDQKPSRNKGKVSTKKPVKRKTTTTRKRKPKRQSLLENPMVLIAAGVAVLVLLGSFRPK